MMHTLWNCLAIATGYMVLALAAFGGYSFPTRRRERSEDDLTRLSAALVCVWVLLTGCSITLYLAAV